MQMDGAPIPAELRHPLAPGMATGIDPILAECWAEYPRLKAAGAAYSALVRLAEITNVLDHRDTGDPVVPKVEADGWGNANCRRDAWPRNRGGDEKRLTSAADADHRHDFHL